MRMVPQLPVTSLTGLGAARPVSRSGVPDTSGRGRPGPPPALSRCDPGRGGARSPRHGPRLPLLAPHGFAFRVFPAHSLSSSEASPTSAPKGAFPSLSLRCALLNVIRKWKLLIKWPTPGATGLGMGAGRGNRSDLEGLRSKTVC